MLLTSQEAKRVPGPFCGCVCWEANRDSGITGNTKVHLEKFCMRSAYTHLVSAYVFSANTAGPATITLYCAIIASA